MPAPRQELATAVLNGNIYVIGGFDSAGQSTSSVFVYNPQSNTWSTAASLPIGNNHGAAAVANGRLFAFGGVSNRTFVYNPAGNAWSEVCQHRRGYTPLSAGSYAQSGSEPKGDPVAEYARAREPPHMCRNSQRPHLPSNLPVSRRSTNNGSSR